MAIFDSEAKDYDSWYESKLGNLVDKVETDLAFSFFTPSPEMKILDVGCGTGNFSIKLAEMGCQVIGIDQSEKMLDEAKKKMKAKGLKIDFFLGDVYDLDFSDEEFDGVFSMAAFEFIKKPEKAYSEMYRVLKQEGSLLIGTINRESEWGELYRTKFFQGSSVFKHADFKSMEDLRSLNSEKIINSGECLFIPPTAEEKDITSENEKQLSLSKRGGFICVLWQKNA